MIRYFFSNKNKQESSEIETDYELYVTSIARRLHFTFLYIADIFAHRMYFIKMILYMLQICFHSLKNATLYAKHRAAHFDANGALLTSAIVIHKVSIYCEISVSLEFCV